MTAIDFIMRAITVSIPFGIVVWGLNILFAFLTRHHEEGRSDDN